MVSSALLTLLASAATANAQVYTNLAEISRLWGQISTYNDHPENGFGVDVIGLPDGCQVEQAHLLQRHAQRFPTGSAEDGTNDLNFAQKVTNFTSANPTEKFTGPLAFLNTYQTYLTSSGYLTNEGATTEFHSGASFWNKYGRILYNYTAGQVAYNQTYQNDTLRKKPVLRTTSQSRIENSQINWALGFFGQSFLTVPDPTLSNVTAFFDVVIIPEGGTENNTLASYDSCFNDDYDIPGYLGDQDVFEYIPIYMKDAVARMGAYAPSGFDLNVNDTYAMQSICAYESGYYGDGLSNFCDLFTLDEWNGFEQTLDIEYYYDYSFGNPTGRAQGIGYLQELLSRLQGQYITSSNSSVNYTIDNNANDFPLNEPFYADFTHDDIIVSVLTAMSMDYFRDAPSLKTYPPDPDRHFILSHMTPFGARLITEVISCASADPTPADPGFKMQYFPSQYGWSATNAKDKFIRMRLNNGILPLSSIRGGACDNGRPDGLCSMADFLKSQEDADEMANYQYACFGDYNTTLTAAQWYSGMDFDGTINSTFAG